LVNARATFTAFSTASAPELNSADFLWWSPGVISLSFSQTVDVGLVAGHHETGVDQLVGLLVDPLDNQGSAVADVDHGDARAEVDERVAVHVHDDTAACTIGIDRYRSPERGRHRGLAPLREFLRLGAWDRGDDLTLLGQVGAECVGHAVRSSIFHSWP
jgi:hypothetical protein